MENFFKINLFCQFFNYKDFYKENDIFKRFENFLECFSLKNKLWFCKILENLKNSSTDFFLKLRLSKMCFISFLKSLILNQNRIKKLVLFDCNNKNYMKNF